MRGKDHFYSMSALLPMAVLLAVFLLPLASTFSRAFISDGAFSLELMKDVVSDPYTWHLLRFTLLESMVSAVVSLLLALPGAYLFANYDFKGRKLILSLSSLCFVLPSILVVLGFVIFYGNSGVINQVLEAITGRESPLRILYSFKAIILAHAFLNMPVALSLLSDSWEHWPRNTENAARTLGARPSRVFFNITLPHLLPSMLSAAMLVFLFCFTSFSIILVLGGGPEYTTLEVEIYRTNNILLDSSKASALAVFSTLINLVLILLSSLASQRAKTQGDDRTSRKRKVEKTRTRIILLVHNIILLFFILGPLVSIVLRSFHSTSKRYGEGFSLRSYQEIFSVVSTTGAMSSALEGLVNSLITALVTALLSTTLALLLALHISHRKSKTLEVIAMMPLAVSSVTLGLGWSIIRSSVDSSSLFLSYLFVILAHLVVALPFALRSLLPAAKSLDGRTLQAAYTMGASTGRACLGVEVPALHSSMAKAFIFSFALSMGEVNATMTLAEGRVVTLPILLYRLINSYNYQGACAVGTLLILATLAIFITSQVLSEDRRTP